MTHKYYTEKEVLCLTSKSIHSFYKKKPDWLVRHMAKDFIWIGAFDLQWTESSEAFLQTACDELKESPVLLADESYHLLTHEGNLWIVYGRYTTMSLKEYILSAHVRVTVVWRETESRMILLHIHGSNAADYPPIPYSISYPPDSNKTSPATPTAGTTQTLPADSPSPSSSFSLTEDEFFRYMRSLSFQSRAQFVLTFRDSQGVWHRLPPAQIRYVQAENQWCLLFAHENSFLIRGGISQMETRLPYFIRIHRSYLVNPFEAVSLRRYKLELKGGEFLPVSKDRYMEVKKKFASL